MVCVHCGSETKVINSRPQKRNNQVWRRRQCVNCKAVFTSEEQVAYSASWSIKTDSGKMLPFNRDKLFLSLYECCKHRKTASEDAAALTDTIIKKVAPNVNNGVVDMRTVAQVSLVALNRFDKAAGVQYQAYHISKS